MSYRYANAIVDPGLNTLIAPAPIPIGYTYNLFTWGSNSYGSLGLNNTTYYSSPKQVGVLTDWAAISSRNGAVLSVKTNGTLWAWGFNVYGQLGLGNTTYAYSSPVQVGALTNWLDVSSGQRSSIAIKTNGTIWSWGFNNAGQLGLGDTTNRSSPVQIGSLTTWQSVNSGRYFTFAIKTDGTLWAWGQNDVGQLGLNNTTYYSSPKQVGSLTNWLKVSGSYSSSVLALKTDGTLWSWGYNYQGQLGLNNQTYYSSPKQIGSLTTWTAMSSFSYGGVAVKGGTLWTWGFGALGALGLGNTTNYSSPMQVGALTNWAYPCGGNYSNFVIKTDGTLWAWGNGGSGRLGLGNTTSYSSPKQIGALNTWKTVAADLNVVALKY